ncbi:MAG TPA: response regulator [Abditibacteriaceae bacterium]|nr:response regulator [Abditibacteriaceae bacterium]
MCHKILVVDDEEHITRAIQISLELSGCEVIIARRGDEALARVFSEGPDLIVLDVMMPDMDGFEVLDRLKANETTAAIPVIMLTARDSYGDVRKAQSLNADFYWTKPFKPSELSTLVQKILQEKVEAP